MSFSHHDPESPSKLDNGFHSLGLSSSVIEDSESSPRASWKTCRHPLLQQIDHIRGCEQMLWQFGHRLMDVQDQAPSGGNERPLATVSSHSQGRNWRTVLEAQIAYVNQTKIFLSAQPNCSIEIVVMPRPRRYRSEHVHICLFDDAPDRPERRFRRKHLWVESANAWCQPSPQPWTWPFLPKFCRYFLCCFSSNVSQTDTSAINQVSFNSRIFRCDSMTDRPLAGIWMVRDRPPALEFTGNFLYTCFFHPLFWLSCAHYDRSLSLRIKSLIAQSKIFLVVNLTPLCLANGGTGRLHPFIQVWLWLW
jgi:hypothetical protein